MAPLGCAVMKHESNTKNTTPNALRSVTCPVRHCKNSRRIDVAKISSRLKVESFCIVSCLVHGRVHIVYFSAVSIHIIFTCFDAQYMLQDTHIKVMKKSTLLEKSSSCGWRVSGETNTGENTQHPNCLVSFSTHTLNLCWQMKSSLYGKGALQNSYSSFTFHAAKR